MKKLPNEIELEQLFKALSEASDEEEVVATEYKNDVLGFINKFSIKSGTEQVFLDFLYSIYKQWSREPVSNQTFASTLDMFLLIDVPQYQNGKRSVLLNKSTFTLAPELWDYFKKNRTNPRVKQKSYIKEFDSFRKECKVQPGKVWVLGAVLYSLYMRWRFSKKQYSTMVMHTFRSFCDLFFDKKRVYHVGRCYRVSNSLFEHVPMEEIAEMTYERIHATKKEKQKKQRKISSTSAKSKSKNQTGIDRLRLRQQAK